MLTVNREMTWEELVKAYPDKWVCFKWREGWGPDVSRGFVKVILEDSEYGSYAAKNITKGYYFKRTTEKEFGGFVSGEGDGFKAV